MSEQIKELCDNILQVISDNNQGITYDDAAHRYEFEGEHLYSVTQILGQLSSYKFQNVPQQILQHKARIGSMTHYLGELLFKASKDKTPSPSVEEYLDEIDPLGLWGETYKNEVVGYWKGMEEYWKKNKFYLFASEFKFVNKKDKYAGTIDLLGVIENMHHDVIGFIGDYKTSAIIDMFTQPLQLCAYGEACNEILGFEFFTMGCLIQIKKDGTFKEYWFNLENFKEGWEILLLNFQVNIRPMLENK